VVLSTKPSVVPAPTPAESASIELPAESLAAQAWIKPMRMGTYMVQHAAMPTYQDALQWQKSQPALSAARIVALYRANQKMAYFAVVSGPFESRSVATEFTKTRGLPAGPWVRSAQSLKDQFTPELANNAGKRQETRP
jgi:septal ring-binding cell division protein DamX